MSESEGEWSPWGSDGEETRRPLITAEQQQEVSDVMEILDALSDPMALCSFGVWCFMVWEIDIS